MNICIITIDSLRYDVAVTADMSNILQYVETKAGKCWQKCGAQGTNTLPAHVALFQGGQAPYSLDKNSKYYKDTFRLFRPQLHWNRNCKAWYNVPESDNIVKGFAALDYHTLGVGGVHWFSTDYQTSAFWEKWYFESYMWHQAFSENDKESFENQLWFLNQYQVKNFSELFLFVNIATTHIPFWQGRAGWEGQLLAAKHVDKLFPQLVNLIAKPCHFIIMGDHGTCFAEEDDGITGHGFVHESVMTVPMCDFILE
jgi:membrane-anchored protein YejM (alkaline phosphatase superfamily)